MLRNYNQQDKSITFPSVATFFTASLLPIKPMNVVLFLVRQEQELRNGATVDKKLSTLADLFRPPIELMHKGSFETVRSNSPDTLHHTSLFCCVFPFSEISDGDCVEHRWETRCAVY